jgi:LacI family transcriptional regulator
MASAPKRQTTQPVTQRQIADLAGVSQFVVSESLRGSLRIAATTRRRVREVATRLGYRPNAFARGIRRGAFGSIALLLSSDYHRSGLPSSLLDGVHDALAKRGIQLTIVKLADEKLADSGFVPRILREYSVDGMLINYTDHIPEKMVHLIESSRMPVVWLNTKQPCNCVYPDDVQAARLATEHMLALGHRRIAYANFHTEASELVEGHYSLRDRQEGYSQAMRAAGLEPWIINAPPGMGSSEGCLAQIYGFMARPDRATALISYSCEPDKIALGAYRQGLRIPEDLSYMVFLAGGEHRHMLARKITNVQLPQRQLASRAVEMLAERISGGPKAVPSVAVPCTLLEAATVARCRSVESSVG